MHTSLNREFLLVICSVLFCGMISCQNTGRANETVPAIALTDHCKADTTNSYEVYIPVREKSAKDLPLLVIIDSHGSGKYALEKFKYGADRYPAVLVASNLVKNDFEGYEGAINTLIEDARQKYPVGTTVYITGFSGGARMALGYALTHPVDGLILCGALAGPDQLNSLKCPVVSISGMDDFNFMETAQYMFQEQTAPANLKIELTDASHNWPDSLMLANAFGFVSLSNKESSASKQVLDNYCQAQEKRVDTLKRKGDFIKAELIARNLASTEPFNHDKTFSSLYSSLKKSPGYNDQMNKLKKNLEFEISVRQPYIDAFQTKDTVWWKNEIKTANEKIKTEKDPYTKDTYLRIKGFWGIACYTFCNRALQGHNQEILKRVVPIYRMLEPENPYVPYFSSFICYWQGNGEGTVLELKKAIKAGFSDTQQLKKDFPEYILRKL